MPLTAEKSEVHSAACWRPSYNLRTRPPYSSSAYRKPGVSEYPELRSGDFGIPSGDSPFSSARFPKDTYNNRIMSVYVLLRTVVPRLLRAKIHRHNWRPTTSNYLWPPRLPGYSLLHIYYDHRSLIEASNCVVLVLNTCGENRARLRRGDIAVASCPSTEQLLDAEQFLNDFLQHNFSTRHVPQQNNFSTQNNFTQNDFSQNNF